LTILEEYLRAHVPADLSPVISAIAATSVTIRKALPMSTGMTRGINPSGEVQAEVDVYANGLFTSSLLATGRVAEVASEEMADVMAGSGTLHVAMDPLDGSSNISTNNPLGSIFGIYSSKLPCSGGHLMGAAFVTYGPMLTLTFAAGGGVQTFVAIERGGHPEFNLLESDLRIPEKPEVFGFGGLRKEWVQPVERFVASLESRGMKLRYGGTFVGDYNQVLRYGGIFGYPALESKPKGKLRVLYEAAPMAYITRQAHGRASDGSRDILSLTPSSLAESTPVYMGTESLVREAEAMIAGR
jgi:fructose-1,6-bisphosphatase I